MMTQTHVLLASAGFMRSGQPIRNMAAIMGGLLPDMALYTLFAQARMQGVSMGEIFRVRYWTPTWQAIMAPGNSIPLYLGLLCAGFAIWCYVPRLYIAGIAIMVLAAAALTHVMLDLPLHVNDGHPHFWPFTDWRFQSPVSYWDARHYGNWVRPVEFALGLTCLLILFRRFQATWIRALTVFGMALYIAEPLFFFFAL